MATDAESSLLKLVYDHRFSKTIVQRDTHQIKFQEEARMNDL